MTERHGALLAWHGTRSSQSSAAQSLQKHLWVTAALCSEGTGCGHAGKAIPQAVRNKHCRSLSAAGMCACTHMDGACHEVMWHSTAHC